MDEFWILADLKHGIAPFIGDQDTIERHCESLRKRCRSMGIEDDFNRFIRVSDNFDELEASTIRKTRKLPRRVLFRLKKVPFVMRVPVDE